MEVTSKEIPESLKLSADFPDPPQPPNPPVGDPPPAPPTAPPQKFVREIDLKDGSGVQKFEAESWEGLVDKLAQAQENATRKIRELSVRPKIEPEREVPTPRGPKPLTDAEILALKEGFTANPVETFNKLFEAQLGMPLDQVRAQLAEAEQQKQRQEAERSFVAKHKDDFHNVPENANKIGVFLQKEGLPVTKKNLEYAFQELSDQFVKPQAAVTLPPPPVPPGPRTQEIPPPPVSIPASFGQRVETPAGTGGVDAAEMARIAVLPPAEMKARIEQLYREGRLKAG